MLSLTGVVRFGDGLAPSVRVFLERVALAAGICRSSRASWQNALGEAEGRATPFRSACPCHGIWSIGLMGWRQVAAPQHTQSCDYRDSTPWPLGRFRRAGARVSTSSWWHRRGIAAAPAGQNGSARPNCSFRSLSALTQLAGQPLARRDGSEKRLAAIEAGVEEFEDGVSRPELIRHQGAN